MNRLAVLAAAVSLLLSSAWAQQRVKPEVMLVIASSDTMQLMPDGTAPQCVVQGDDDVDEVDPPAQSTPPNRLMLIKEVLAGARPDNKLQWCIKSKPKDFPDDAVHYRAMCCANQACDEFLPCGPDHGDDSGGRDNTQYDPAIDESGLVYSKRDEIKFGLMTLDHRPDPGGGNAGGFSFGGENFVVPNGVADRVGEGAIQGLVLDAKGQRNPNLGVKNTAARRLGPLLSGNKGLVDVAQPGKGLFFNNAAAEQDEDVADTDQAVRSHNTLVMDRIRGTIGHGPASLSAMLHDLNVYYDDQADDDPGHACRRRFAVLFTDGIQSHFYGGEPCVQDADCVHNGFPGGACVQTLSREPTVAAQPCPAGQVPVGGQCYQDMKACVYRRGWPYDLPENYAEQLEERGIPLFVVGFEGGEQQQVNEQLGRLIASRGSPGLRADGSDGFYPVSDAGELVDALDAILNETQKGIITRAKPLIVAPQLPDRIEGNDVRQWRYTTFTEVPGVTDEARYGRVLASEYGCPDGLDPDDSTSLQFLRDVRYDQLLQADNASRRVVTRDPKAGNPVGIVRASNAQFRDDGNRDANANEQDLRSLARAAPAAAGQTDPLRIAGRMLNGFFGRRGLPDGADGDPAGEQLGAIVYGDLVAVPPPNIGVATPAYLKHEATYAKRPTMIIGGAADGQVHVFRARDGKELMTFVPRAGWQDLRRGNGLAPVDGPLDVGEVAECRKLGGVGGDETCPDNADEVNFRTVLVGGVGSNGANIFGLDVTKAFLAAGGDSLNMDTVMNDASNRPYIWNIVNDEDAEYGFSGDPEERATRIVSGLGRSISRPMLGHVVQEPGDLGSGKVKAAAIVGCGDDPATDSRFQDKARGNLNDPRPTGRCVMVVGARDGELIRVFDGADNELLNRPMTGSPVFFPNEGTAIAELAFIGDAHGRLWRVDLTERDPRDWTMDIIWPLADAGENAPYQLGNMIVDRPSVSVREDGKLVIVFGTNYETADRAYMVSLTHSSFLDENGNKTYKVEKNWVFRLSQGEQLTGAPITRNEITWFTTSAPGGGDGCVSSQGRLYGIDFAETGPNLTRGNDTFNVVPRIPFFNDQGEREGFSLSILLPPGRIAYGLAIVTTPSCFDDAASTTDLVLNLADESGGATGAIQKDQLRAEKVQNGSVQATPIGSAGVFAKTGTNDLSLCLDCDLQGKSLGAGVSGKVAPFPSVLTYWGATFSQ